MTKLNEAAKQNQIKFAENSIRGAQNRISELEALRSNLHQNASTRYYDNEIVKEKDAITAAQERIALFS